MAQGDDFGYLEGRIIERRAQTDTETIAVVRLSDGRTVDAQLPGADPWSDFEMPEFKVGDRVEVYFSPGPGGEVVYVVSDWVRRPALFGLIALFAVVSFVIARFKGLRAFLATGASLWIVISFVVPRILGGWDPMVVSLIGVGGMLLLNIYFVHGANWSTTAAMVGTFIAAMATFLLGALFSDLARLTGLGADEALLLMSAAPQVALQGLMLAGLMIGALGALTDITIVQAAVIRELAHTDPKLGLWQLYNQGMRVGHDHVGSLVNTLVLAYTGTSLSLLILLNVGEVPFSRAFNMEVVASEVVHTLVGSIGLILAVPITTFLAALLFRGDRIPLKPGELEHGHSHGHKH